MMESLHNDVMDLGTRYVKWNAMLTRSGVSSLTESEIEAQLSEHLTIERLLNATNVEAFRERFREIIVELDRQNKARGIVNPDFEAEKMKLEDLIGKLDAKRKRMEGAWQAKIETLKNCLQRKQLDEKIEKVNNEREKRSPRYTYSIFAFPFPVPQIRPREPFLCSSTVAYMLCESRRQERRTVGVSCGEREPAKMGFRAYFAKFSRQIR